MSDRSIEKENELMEEEATRDRIKMLVNMNQSMKTEIDEYLRVIIDATASIQARIKVTEQTTNEIEILQGELIVNDNAKAQ